MAYFKLASHADVFRGLVLNPLWGGGNTSLLKATAWEANCKPGKQMIMMYYSVSDTDILEERKS